MRGLARAVDTVDALALLLRRGRLDDVQVIETLVEHLLVSLALGQLRSELIGHFASLLSTAPVALNAL